MEFFPEEYIHLLLVQLNNYENKLENCNFETYLKAFKVYYNLIFINLDPYISINYANKLLKAKVNCNNQEQIIVNNIVEFIKSNIKIQEKNIEIEKRKILN